MGHSKRYREMHLLGVCGHGEIVGSVEERLIGERRGIDDNCMNKGKGRERVSRTSRNAKFFYIVTLSWSSNNALVRKREKVRERERERD